MRFAHNEADNKKRTLRLFKVENWIGKVKINWVRHAIVFIIVSQKRLHLSEFPHRVCWNYSCVCACVWYLWDLAFSFYPYVCVCARPLATLDSGNVLALIYIRRSTRVRQQHVLARHCQYSFGLVFFTTVPGHQISNDIWPTTMNAASFLYACILLTHIYTKGQTNTNNINQSK